MQLLTTNYVVYTNHKISFYRYKKDWRRRGEIVYKNRKGSANSFENFRIHMQREMILRKLKEGRLPHHKAAYCGD